MCRKEGQANKETKERKQIRRSFQGLNLPPPVHTLTATAKECGDFPHQALSFPTGTSGEGMSDVS